MLNFWSKPFLQSESKNRKYLIFVDDSDYKTNPNNSYMLVTEDFKSFIVKNVPNNRIFSGAVKLNGEIRIIAKSYAINPDTSSSAKSWYDIETFRLDENNDLISIAIRELRDDKNDLGLTSLEAKVSNGSVVLAGKYHRSSGETARSYDLVNWEYVFPRTGHTDPAVKPTIKDGLFYAYSAKNGCGVKRSRDTITWETMPNTEQNDNFSIQIAHCDSFFILTLGKIGNGKYDPCSYCKTSPNGSDWSNLNYPDQIHGYCVEGKNFILVYGPNYSGTYKFFKLTSPNSFQEVKIHYDGVEYAGDANWKAFPVDDAKRFITVKDNIVYESNDAVNFTSIGSFSASYTNFREVIEVSYD